MAKQIRDTQIIKTPEVVIDPRFFFVPDDVAGVRPATTEDLIPNDPENDYESGIDYDADLLIDEGGELPVDPGTTDTPGTLQTPQTITVVSQTVRITSDGTTVVDVVLGVQDVAGATNYEVRVTV
jgi:hypothetical protein